MHRADVLHIDRRALLRLEWDVLDVLDLFDVAATAHVILSRTDFKNPSAHVAVGPADFVHDFVEGDAVGRQLVRVEVHLILLHEAADRRDFGNSFHRFERVTKVPILEGAQFGEVVLPGFVDKRVFVNPAHARRVRSNLWVDAFGQHAAHGAQVFDDARTRPIDVRPILENDVDEGLPEHGLAANELHFGRSDESRGNRIRDLVFHKVR